MAFFKVENLVYCPPGVAENILRGIDLTIPEGQFVALIGANGSGKTTFARHLNGLLIPSQGRVLVDGVDTRERGQFARIRSWVGMVFQSPEEQIVANTVEEDVAFGLENLGLPPVEIRQRVNSALESVEMEGYRPRPPHQLSAGQMQRVALAGILAMRPRAIVLDEPSAHLDPQGRRELFAMISDLHRQGITIVWITHYMEEAARANRVVVLRAGNVFLDGTSGEVFRDRKTLLEAGLELPPAASLAARLSSRLPGLAVGLLNPEDLLAHLPAYNGKSVAVPEPQFLHRVEEVIRVDTLSYTYLKDTPFAARGLDGVSLHVAEQSSHGLVGSTGSGKSTLLQHLNGLYRPQTGSVMVGSYNLADPKLSLKTVCQLVGLSFQLPELYFFEQFVGDEIAFGPRQMGVEDLAARVKSAMGWVGLDFETFKDRLVYTLSGGEKRKVALASVMALQPKILLLDEPLAGLDPSSRSELMDNLLSWRKEGLAMVISSHAMDEVAEMAERVTVMKRGRDLLAGDVGEVFSQDEALAAVGLEAPLAARVANSLRQKGWPLPVGLVHPESLAQALAALGEGQTA